MPMEATRLVSLGRRCSQLTPWLTRRQGSGRRRSARQRASPRGPPRARPACSAHKQGWLTLYRYRRVKHVICVMRSHTYPTADGQHAHRPHGAHGLPSGLSSCIVSLAAWPSIFAVSPSFDVRQSRHRPGARGKARQKACDRLADAACGQLSARSDLVATDMCVTTGKN